MGSSKKHKKHKEKKSQYEENGSEQRPLKLVLKVGSSTTTASGTSSPVKQETEVKQHITESEAPPKLTLAYGQDPNTGEITVHHSSSKKLKKKKSKKKHHKRCHRHSHHDHHDHHHHRHHRRSHHSKSSSQHHESNAVTSGHTSSAPPIPVINQTITQPSLPDIRSPQRPPFTGRDGKTQFQHLLSHMQKQLQRRDPQEFFAWPVTDLIAPGYSSIIAKPMDFSTMKKKIDQNYYDSLSKFRSDVKLMCDNAMTYNRPDTIYHKAARKLWRYAKDKIFNREALSEFAKLFPGLGHSELGFSHSEPVPMEVDMTRKDNELQYPVIKEESNLSAKEEHIENVADEMNEDDLTAEQILEEAKKAAQAAADRLTLERPKGAHLSFLRQRTDGTTTLGILGSVNEERIVNLESIVGKLNDGISSLPPFKEDESNIVKPVQSLDVPPFSSYLPSVDSSHSSLSAEDTSLLLAAYGEDDLGLQYAQSLLQFSADSDFALNMVDSLLDVLTHGQHSKVLKALKDDKEKTVENGTVSEEVQPDEIQNHLNEANTLITDLRAVQYRRLSSSTQVITPSKEETKLAHDLSNKLCELIANYAAPGEVTDIRGVRKAMGVQVKFD